jgi:hypothetical protein
MTPCFHELFQISFEKQFHFLLPQLVFYLLSIPFALPSLPLVPFSSLPSFYLDALLSLPKPFLWMVVLTS